jgi:hypothetical protein
MARSGVFLDAGKGIYLTGIWMDHNGYSDLCYIAIDSIRGHLYVAWNADPTNESPDVMLYGKNLPPSFAEAVKDDLTTTWGASHQFEIKENRIVATPR